MNNHRNSRGNNDDPSHNTPRSSSDSVIGWTIVVAFVTSAATTTWFLSTKIAPLINRGLSQHATEGKAQLEIGLQKYAYPLQQNQQKLQTDVEWLKNRFQGQRTRGVIGEIQLESVMQSAFSKSQYNFQYTLSNHKRVDCMLRLPPTNQLLSIDSKFPLDSLLRLEEDADNAEKRLQHEKKFKENVKTHITDISSKYIIPGETVDYAVMFVPTEEVHQTLVSMTDVVLFAHKHKVWLCSPTTLVASLYQLQAMSRGMVLSQNNQAIVAQVQKLSTDLERG